MTAAIAVTGLHKSFRDHHILRGIDLHVEPGTIHALLGSNGAGKTTLISILSTLIPADSGQVTIDGFDLTRQAGKVRGSICVTGQSAAVDEILTGSENLRMMARLRGLSKREATIRAADLLDQFGLGEAAHRRVATYSGGMRRRLDIAMSLVTPSSIIFLDEPTTGLDLRSRLTLWNVIRTLCDEGTTILLTTQYLEEADQLEDVISVLGDGQIVAQGTPDQLKSLVSGEVLELVSADGTVLESRAIDGSVQSLADALGTLTEQPGSRVHIRRPSMDDVYLHLTETERTAR